MKLHLTTGVPWMIPPAASEAVWEWFEATKVSDWDALVEITPGRFVRLVCVDWPTRTFVSGEEFPG